MPNSGPLLSRPGSLRRPWLGEPLGGTQFGSVALHYLAGLREVPAEVLTLVLALGRGIFVASSAVGVWHLSHLSSRIVRLSFRDLSNPAALLV